MKFLDLAYALAAVITAPFWARKTRADWPARFGHAPDLGPTSPGRPRILLHAVSVGEVNAIRGLVALLAPDADVVVSVGTDTGIARARELFESPAAHAPARVVRYPLDFSWSVLRFLNAVRPDAVGLVELELWPNFVRACVERRIPVAVINGRLSERSFKGYKRFRFFFRRTFSSLHTAAVQDATYAKRFIEMGVPPDRCIVTDTMKWDAVSLSAGLPAADDLARTLGIDRTRLLVVAGSTAEDEESLLHHACPPGVQLLCAPRKLEHFDEAAAALPGCVRRSATLDTGAVPAHTTDRFLLDTIGELRAAYSLADVVVVGRSFGRLYGSDPIEPISVAKATLIGPSYADFRTVVQAFLKSGGIRVVSRDELPKVLTDLLENPDRRAEIARRGQECIRAHQGATKRHAELLLSLVAQHAAAEHHPAPTP